MGQELAAGLTENERDLPVRGALVKDISYNK